jgi:hypothetical protein
MVSKLYLAIIKNKLGKYCLNLKKLVYNVHVIILINFSFALAFGKKSLKS